MPHGQTTLEVAGSDPVTAGVVRADSLPPISFPQPLGSQLWQPMCAFSLAAPPGLDRANWTTSGKQELFLETGQPPSPAEDADAGLRIPSQQSGIVEMPRPFVRGWDGTREERGWRQARAEILPVTRGGSS